MARYHIYCDESGQMEDDNYIVFAGICISETDRKGKDPSSYIFDKHRKNAIARDNWLNGSFKWSKISKKTINWYKSFFQWFLSSNDVYFGSLIVDRRKDNSEYEQLLSLSIYRNFVEIIKNKDETAVFIIHLLSGKKISNKNHFQERLNYYIWEKADDDWSDTIESLRIVGKNSYGIQIADLLAGVVRYYHSNHYHSKSASSVKKEMAKCIDESLGPLYPSKKYMGNKKRIHIWDYTAWKEEKNKS